MKKPTAKLRLDRQTIKLLSSSALHATAGGARATAQPALCVTKLPTGCPSVTISDCTSCNTACSPTV